MSFVLDDDLELPEGFFTTWTREEVQEYLRKKLDKANALVVRYSRKAKENAGEV